jgi:hypothetical protein
LARPGGYDNDAVRMRKNRPHFGEQDSPDVTVTVHKTIVSNDTDDELSSARYIIA